MHKPINPFLHDIRPAAVAVDKVMILVTVAGKKGMCNFHEQAIDNTATAGRATAAEDNPA
jgi:hypothetical protein